MFLLCYSDRLHNAQLILHSRSLHSPTITQAQLHHWHSPREPTALRLQVKMFVIQCLVTCSPIRNAFE